MDLFLMVINIIMFYVAILNVSDGEHPILWGVVAMALVINNLYIAMRGDNGNE